jgi:hypothetical membrane protein
MHAFACSPLHDVMNAAFVVTGVCCVLGAILGWRAWPRRPLSTVGLTFIILAGLGFVVVGLNPEDVNVRLHILGASNLVFSNVGLLLLGLATRPGGGWWSKLALTMAAGGFAGLLSGPLLMATFGHGGGLAERLALYPVVLYLVIVGVWLVRYGGTRQPRIARMTESPRSLSGAA